jgi:hypothetical protein
MSTIKTWVPIATALLLIAASGLVWNRYGALDSNEVDVESNRSTDKGRISMARSANSADSDTGDAEKHHERLPTSERANNYAKPSNPARASSQSRKSGESQITDQGFSLPWLPGIDPKGIPFPMSESIKRACEEMKHLGTASCAEHYAVLDWLANESRDEKWAASVVASIASAVASQPDYFIRAIDCRMTLCAIEIESTRGVFRHTTGTSTNTIELVDRVFGYETSESNQMVKVTSMTFRRR